jgi:hypothetical protein
MPGVMSRSPQRSRKRLSKPNHRRALELLASCRDGCTEAIMLAHGFTIEQMVELVAGLLQWGGRDPPISCAWSI